MTSFIRNIYRGSIGLVVGSEKISANSLAEDDEQGAEGLIAGGHDGDEQNPKSQGAQGEAEPTLSPKDQHGQASELDKRGEDAVGTADEKRKSVGRREHLRLEIRQHVVDEYFDIAYGKEATDPRFRRFPPRWPPPRSIQPSLRPIHRGSEFEVNGIIENIYRPYLSWYSLDTEASNSKDADVEAQKLKDLISQYKQDREAAQQSIQSGTFLYPNTIDACRELEVQCLVNRAHLAYNQKEYTKTITLALDALRLADLLDYAPMSARCWYWIGLAHLEQGFRLTAAEDLVRALPCIGRYREGENMSACVDSLRNDMLNILMRKNRAQDEDYQHWSDWLDAQLRGDGSLDQGAAQTSPDSTAMPQNVPGSASAVRGRDDKESTQDVPYTSISGPSSITEPTPFSFPGKPAQSGLAQRRGAKSLSHIESPPREDASKPPKKTPLTSAASRISAITTPGSMEEMKKWNKRNVERRPQKVRDRMSQKNITSEQALAEVIDEERKVMQYSQHKYSESAVPTLSSSKPPTSSISLWTPQLVGDKRPEPPQRPVSELQNSVTTQANRKRDLLEFRKRQHGSYMTTLNGTGGIWSLLTSDQKKELHNRSPSIPNNRPRSTSSALKSRTPSQTQPTSGHSLRSRMANHKSDAGNEQPGPGSAGLISARSLQTTSAQLEKAYEKMNDYRIFEEKIKPVLEKEHKKHRERRISQGIPPDIGRPASSGGGVFRSGVLPGRQSRSPMIMTQGDTSLPLSTEEQELLTRSDLDRRGMPPVLQPASASIDRQDMPPPSRPASSTQSLLAEQSTRDASRDQSFAISGPSSSGSSVHFPADDKLTKLHTWGTDSPPSSKKLHKATEKVKDVAKDAKKLLKSALKTQSSNTSTTPATTDVYSTLPGEWGPALPMEDNYGSRWTSSSSFEEEEDSSMHVELDTSLSTNAATEKAGSPPSKPGSNDRLGISSPAPELSSNAPGTSSVPFSRSSPSILHPGLTPRPSTSMPDLPESTKSPHLAQNPRKKSSFFSLRSRNHSSPNPSRKTPPKTHTDSPEARRPCTAFPRTPPSPSSPPGHSSRSYRQPPSFPSPESRGKPLPSLPMDTPAEERRPSTPSSPIGPQHDPEPPVFPTQTDLLDEISQLLNTSESGFGSPSLSSSDDDEDDGDDVSQPNRTLKTPSRRQLRTRFIKDGNDGDDEGNYGDGEGEEEDREEVEEEPRGRTKYRNRRRGGIFG